MRWGKEWSGWNGSNHRTLLASIGGHNVLVSQYNSGAKANFTVEVCGLSVHEQNVFTIPGKGDEALKQAWAKAKELHEKYNEGGERNGQAD